jgi:hypothetical protein
MHLVTIISRNPTALSVKMVMQDVIRVSQGGRSNDIDGRLKMNIVLESGGFTSGRQLLGLIPVNLPNPIKLPSTISSITLEIAIECNADLPGTKEWMEEMQKGSLCIQTRKSMPIDCELKSLTLRVWNRDRRWHHGAETGKFRGLFFWRRNFRYSSR